MTSEQKDSLEKQRMWNLLTGKQQRFWQEYEVYYRRNPPRELRPLWQKVLIVSVPVVILTALITVTIALL